MSIMGMMWIVASVKDTATTVGLIVTAIVTASTGYVGWKAFMKGARESRNSASIATLQWQREQDFKYMKSQEERINYLVEEVAECEKTKRRLESLLQETSSRVSKLENLLPKPGENG
jgi:chromosome segregation ATPase